MLVDSPYKGPVMQKSSACHGGSMIDFKNTKKDSFIKWTIADNKAKPHGCCIFSMILHEAPSMETTTPKGEWFPCWVAEWSIMENMQQQMWFCFYPSSISINISIYIYNALRLTPEIWFWAMRFTSFQIDMNKYFAIVSPRCQVISNCDLMSSRITWQNNRYAISKVTGY